MDIISFLSQVFALLPQWVYLTFAAIVCWSFCSYYDSVLVDCVYHSPNEGGVIAGHYAIYPAVLFLGLMLYNGTSAPLLAQFVAMIGGALFLFHYHYLYKVLHLYNDAAWVDAISNSSIIVIPPLLFIVGLDSFTWGHMIGAVLASVGTLWLILKKRKKVLRNKSDFLALILSLALSLVVMDYSYAISDDEFFNVIGFFFMGMYVLGWVLRYKYGNGERIRALVMRHRFRFMLVNSIDLLGMLCFQWAISLTPSLSFVMVLEGFTPVVTMSIAVAILLSTRAAMKMKCAGGVFFISSGAELRKLRHKRNLRVAKDQLNFGVEKLVPIAFLAWGGFVLYYDHVIHHEIRDGYLILTIPLTTPAKAEQLPLGTPKGESVIRASERHHSD